MRRVERLEMIKDLVSKVPVHKQSDLVEYFKTRGHSVTQATISRDIKDLGLVRRGTADGTVYALPGQLRFGSMNLLATAITQMARHGSLVRLDVSPGTAMGVKNALRLRHDFFIFAILTDDDTVLIYAKSNEQAKRIEELLSYERDD